MVGICILAFRLLLPLRKAPVSLQLHGFSLSIHSFHSCSSSMSWHGKSHFSFSWSTQQLSIWDWTESSGPSWGAFKVRPPSFAASTSSQCQPRVYIWAGVCRGTVTRLASVINKPVQYRLLTPTVDCNVNLPGPDSVWVETRTVAMARRARSSIPNKLIKNVSCFRKVNDSPWMWLLYPKDHHTDHTEWAVFEPSLHFKHDSILFHHYSNFWNQLT